MSNFWGAVHLTQPRQTSIAFGYDIENGLCIEKVHKPFYALKDRVVQFGKIAARSARKLLFRCRALVPDGMGRIFGYESLVKIYAECGGEHGAVFLVGVVTCTDVSLSDE